MQQNESYTVSRSNESKLLQQMKVEVSISSQPSQPKFGVRSNCERQIEASGKRDSESTLWPGLNDDGSEGWDDIQKELQNLGEVDQAYLGPLCDSDTSDSMFYQTQYVLHGDYEPVEAYIGLDPADSSVLGLSSAIVWAGNKTLNPNGTISTKVDGASKTGGDAEQIDDRMTKPDKHSLDIVDAAITRKNRAKNQKHGERCGGKGGDGSREEQGELSAAPKRQLPRTKRKDRSDDGDEDKNWEPDAQTVRQARSKRRKSSYKTETYHCKKCDKPYFSRGNLVRHFRTATVHAHEYDQTMYTCPECNYRKARWDLIRRHCQKKHGYQKESKTRKK